MSSLWTPYGEQPVEGDQSGIPDLGAPQPGGGPAGPGPVGPDGLPEDFDPEQMREMLTRLASTPVEMIVAQFAVQLQELAILHLSLSAERHESLQQARLAIDTLAAVVDGLGERLAPNDEPLRQALAQTRLAYVEVTEHLAAEAGAQDGAEPPGPAPE